MPDGNAFRSTGPLGSPLVYESDAIQEVDSREAMGFWVRGDQQPVLPKHDATGDPFSDLSSKSGAFGTDSRNQALTALGPTTLENSTTRRCSHPGTESVRPLTLDIAWLICAFHDILLNTEARSYSASSIDARVEARLIPPASTCAYGPSSDRLPDLQDNLHINFRLVLFKSLIYSLYF